MAILNYYACLQEIKEDEVKYNTEVAGAYVKFSNVSAGLGGGFENTNELKPMKYNEAIHGPNGKAWKQEIKNEHIRMVKNQVFEEVNKNDLPEGTKVIDSTWVCKKKNTGTLQGQLNTRGFKQIPGKHYDPFSIASPVTNGMTICIVLTIMLAIG